tara:strand:+ start:114 stop:683 length:570 start_codon:yes stop_codon:yes gene_type:complete
MEKVKEIYAKNRKEWRDWLAKNHNKEKKVHLIKYKRHTGKPALSHKESMEEAICFGWIDTTIKRLDEDRFRRTFVRRGKNARWSRATLGYAKKMIEEKRMTKAGMDAYELGLKKPPMDHFIRSKNPDTPKDLEKQLEKSKKAKEFFQNLAPSYKRYYIYWVESAKRQETKNKRIKEVFDRCKESKKPGV